MRRTSSDRNRTVFIYFTETVAAHTLPACSECLHHSTTNPRQPEALVENMTARSTCWEYVPASSQKNFRKAIQLCAAARAAAVGVPRAACTLHAQREVAAGVAHHPALALKANNARKTVAAAAACTRSRWSDRLVQRRVQVIDAVRVLLFFVCQLLQNAPLINTTRPHPARGGCHTGDETRY